MDVKPNIVVRKARMTKQRRSVLDYMKRTGSLVLVTFTDGARHYSMSDGKWFSPDVLELMARDNFFLPVKFDSLFGEESQQLGLM